MKRMVKMFECGGAFKLKIQGIERPMVQNSGPIMPGMMRMKTP